MLKVETLVVKLNSLHSLPNTYEFNSYFLIKDYSFDSGKLEDPT